MADNSKGSLSGLSDNEAKEFHGIFITSFIIFTVIAVVAHFLAWQWRPWPQLSTTQKMQQRPISLSRLMHKEHQHVAYLDSF